VPERGIHEPCLVTGRPVSLARSSCEALRVRGHEVVGVDAFIPYYPRAVKERNLRDLTAQPRFTFYETDLRTADLAPVVTAATPSSTSRPCRA